MAPVRQNGGAVMRTHWLGGLIMRAFLLALLVVVGGTTPAFAQITVVQTPVAFSGDDAVATFGSNWTENNHVLILLHISNVSNNVSITGVSESVTTVVAETTYPSNGSRGYYAFCFQVDASADNGFVASTTSTASANGIAIEVSGGTCSLDGSDAFETTSSGQIELDGGVTTSVCGSIVMGIIQAANTADFGTPDANYTSVPASETEFASSTMLGQYRITTATGTYPVPFDPVDSEQITMVGIGMQPASPCSGAAAPCYRGLLRVGCEVQQ
jgi:hypothetical protein